MSKYIYQQDNWPKFHWDNERLTNLVASIRYKQGRLMGYMDALGFNLRTEALLETLAINIIKTSEIEGELLNQEQVRSSIARRLGMDVAGLVESDRNIDAVVEMMLDATQNFDAPLTKDRLFGWHTLLFTTYRNSIYKINVGGWREGIMQVVSGGFGMVKVHFEAPAASFIELEMEHFLNWFNSEFVIDPIIKAAIAHFWFVTIHPFDDGNGRIARAIADMQLARTDGSAQRYYSMTAQILKERNDYYDILEQTQRGTLDITNWLNWFLTCLNRALDATDTLLARVINKAKFWDKFSKTYLNNRQNLMLNKLLDGFDGKLTTTKWAKITKCSQDTALRDIQDLIDKGALLKEIGGGRSTAYCLVYISY